MAKRYFTRPAGVIKAIEGLVDGETVYEHIDENLRFSLWRGWTRQLGGVSCW